MGKGVPLILRVSKVRVKKRFAARLEYYNRYDQAKLAVGTGEARIRVVGIIYHSLSGF